MELRRIDSLTSGDAFRFDGANYIFVKRCLSPIEVEVLFCYHNDNGHLHFGQRVMSGSCLVELIRAAKDPVSEANSDLASLRKQVEGDQIIVMAATHLYRSTVVTLRDNVYCCRTYTYSDDKWTHKCSLTYNPVDAIRWVAEQL